MKKITCILPLIAFIHVCAYAQQIREQDIVYSRYIVREIDLRSSGNIKVFGKNCLLSFILLDAVKHGAKAYSYVDRTTQVSFEQIEDKLQMFALEDSCMSFLTAEELYVVELTERIIFDKNASEFRFIPIELTLFIPAEINIKGIMEPLAVFSFEECTRIFRTDLRAYSSVTKIGQQRINFNEQFLLRSYESIIVKIGNEEDLYFDQLYADPYKAFMAMQKEENDLEELIFSAYHPK